MAAAAPPGGAPLPPYLRIEHLGGGVALLTLAKEPVNSMDTAMWLGLHAALRTVEADASVNALIITSGLAKDVFTAGNDLGELYAPRTSAARYRTFWVAQSAFLRDLLTSRLATVAAVRGACPAGGCMLAMCCDVRLMTPDGGMGLNEVALGIPVPRFWAARMAQLIGQRAADDLVLNGRMIGAAEAARLGLVDQLLPKGELQGAAEARAAALAKLPNAARAATKLSLRQDFCAAWEQYYSGDEPEWGWRMLAQPATVAQLGAVLKRLGGGKAAPKL